MSADEKPRPTATELVEEQISEIEKWLAIARRRIAEGHAGAARVVLALGCAREISPGVGVGELVDAFERMRPGFSTVLGRPLSLAPAARREALPLESLRAVTAAAAQAEQWACLVVEGAFTENEKLADEALDGLVECALAAAEARRGP